VRIWGCEQVSSKSKEAMRRALGLGMFLGVFAGNLSVATAQEPLVRIDAFNVTLSQTFGRALFRRCALQIVTVGHNSGGLATLTCTLQVDPPERDIVVERRISENDVEAIRAPLQQSDLYGGGHTGRGNSASEGPWELLQVTCCGRQDMIVLVTQGNTTFEGGPRQELLDVLHRWLRDLQTEGLSTYKRTRRR